MGRFQMTPKPCLKRPNPAPTGLIHKQNETGEWTGIGTSTGVAFARGLGFQVKGNGKTAPANFIFVTEGGAIVGWASGLGSDLPNDAFITVDNSANGNGAVYKGATIAQMAMDAPSLLYVANFRSG